MATAVGTESAEVRRSQLRKLSIGSRRLGAPRILRGQRVISLCNKGGSSTSKAVRWLS